ncbi:MAG: DUF599 family protein [Ancalomicrobiaceae bacterium]|nr:DUF599 family protein [Ancalomicrobiaceae bacterium]
MDELTRYDLSALAWYLLAWGMLGWLSDYAPNVRPSLSRLMNASRHRWMMEMLRRDVRIVDTAILSSLQNGTAFFASTSLIALGGTLALLNQSERVQLLFSDLPLHVAASKQLLEIKVLGLAVIYGYAFFKFGWAYRLFNYTAILVGAVPPPDHADEPETKKAANRAAAMQIQAGSHFHWGLRSLFFSVGYLGWFLGPVVFCLTTTLIAAVLTHRQFWSRARNALMDDEDALASDDQGGAP